MTFRETKILKNFDYPVACIDMNLSESGNFLVSIGTYKPSVKIHDLQNISQKSNRHLESEPLKVISLDRNAEKLCILRIDRYVEFHVKYGMHERIRMPKTCYDLKLNKFNRDIIAAGKSPELYRFNLEKGEFVKSYTSSLNSIKSIDINSTHGLIGYCDDKIIEFIDQRTGKIVNTSFFDYEFSTFEFSNNGLNFGVGAENGQVFKFDLRSKIPINNYTHESRINKIKMVNKNLISSDKNAIKIFKEGKIETINIEKPINTFEIDGGVVFVGMDDVNMKTYVSCDFGEIPNWCNIIKVDDEI